jgi:ABC-type nitrate/sulfonate/bicarbonate transport system permease component
MRFLATLLQTIIGLAVLGVIWWGAVTIAPPPANLFPGPEEVANKAIDLVEAEAFRQHAFASLDVALYGLLPALVLGILIGAAAGSGAGQWLFGPFTITIATAPLVAVLPLLVLWFGAGITPKLVFVFLATVFAVANTIKVRWPRRYDIKLAAEAQEPRAWGARGLGRTCAVIGGLRVGFVSGVAALVTAELVGSNVGLGYFVASGALFNTSDAMAAALIILLPTIAVGAFLQAIEEQLAG